MFLKRPEKTEFYAKTWIFWAQIIFFVPMTLFCTICGPLFLWGDMRDAHGQPATDAGLVMTMLALPLAMFTGSCVFSVLTRRRPLLRLCREGILLRTIGSRQKPSFVEIVLGHIGKELIYFAVAVLHGRVFRQRSGWIPWEEFFAVRVIGPAMSHVLVLEGNVGYFCADRKAEIGHEPCVQFCQVEFRDSIHLIAKTIDGFYKLPDLRADLPSMHD